MVTFFLSSLQLRRFFLMLFLVSSSIALPTKGALETKPSTTQMDRPKATPSILSTRKTYLKKAFLKELATDAIPLPLLLVGLLFFAKANANGSTNVEPTTLGEKILNKLASSWAAQLGFGLSALVISFFKPLVLKELISSTTNPFLTFAQQIFKIRWITDLLFPLLLFMISFIVGVVGENKPNWIPEALNDISVFCCFSTAYLSFLVSFIRKGLLYLQLWRHASKA